MPNIQGATVDFKKNSLNGFHNFGVGVIRASTAADSFKGALYSSGASISPATPAYTATGEVTGAGYVAGGVAFTFGTPPAESGTSGIVTPSAALTFTGVSIGPFNCCLMYNDTLPGKNSVAAYTFTEQTIIAGDFQLTMPVNAAGTALLEFT